MMKNSNSKESESVRHKLMHAGYHDADALTVFYAFKGISLIFGLALAAAIYFLFPDMSMLNLALVVSVGAGCMLLMLFSIIKSTNVKKKIRGGIADALDLLVYYRVGWGSTAALRRVADEINISHPDFADELDTVCVKINAGVEMSDAFDDLIDRTGLTEIAGLAVTMLAHASRIGGSLSQTLREYTEDYRDKRNQEVEEIAAKIPTKMIFPLLLFICVFLYRG